METCFFLLRRHPHVFMDISGVPPQNLRTYFPRLEEVATKTLWGTDWPGPMVPDLGTNLAAFRRLGLSATAESAILTETARSIFG